MVHPEDKFLLCRIFVSDSLLDLEDNLEGFPGGSGSKEFACNEGDLGSIPGLGRTLKDGNGNQIHYSCLGNPMDRGAWRATDHGVAKSRTQLSD